MAEAGKTCQGRIGGSVRYVRDVQTFGSVQFLSSTSLPKGEYENSPGWSSPKRPDPWERGSIRCGPPLRVVRTSPPNVTRVVGDVVFLQEGDELRLEISFAMMLILVPDVRNCGADLSLPDGEGAITFLPFEALNHADSVHPMRRDALDFSHGCGDRHGRRQRQEKMDTVFCSSDLKSLHAVIPRNAAHVGPQPRLDLRGDDLGAVLGGKDTMSQRATIGV